MLEVVLVYSLSLYLAYHVLSRSDLLTKPRAWVRRVLPKWATYPLECALCATFWMGVVLTILGFVNVPLWVLLSAPVVNMVLDLVVRALIRANAPLVAVGEGKTVTQGDQNITTWTGPTVVSAMAGNYLRSGELVSLVANGDGVKIPESMRYAHLTPPPPPWGGPPPLGWVIDGTAGDPYSVRFSCPSLHGRGVRTSYFGGLTGTIISGFRNGDDCSGTFGELMYRLRWNNDQTWMGHPMKGETGDVPVKSCTFLDEPFNPLAHEQTK